MVRRSEAQARMVGLSDPTSRRFSRRRCVSSPDLSPMFHRARCAFFARLLLSLSATLCGVAVVEQGGATATDSSTQTQCGRLRPGKGEHTSHKTFRRRTGRPDTHAGPRWGHSQRRRRHTHARRCECRQPRLENSLRWTLEGSAARAGQGRPPYPNAVP